MGRKCVCEWVGGGGSGEGECIALFPAPPSFSSLALESPRY